jgi:hypothetical protein
MPPRRGLRTRRTAAAGAADVEAPLKKSRTDEEAVITTTTVVFVVFNVFFSRY